MGALSGSAGILCKEQAKNLPFLSHHDDITPDKNSETCRFESLSNNDDDPDQLQLKILQLKLKIAMRRHKHDPIHKPAQQIFDPSGIPKPQSIKSSTEVSESDHETVLKHSTKVKKEIDTLIKSEVFDQT